MKADMSQAATKQDVKEAINEAIEGVLIEIRNLADMTHHRFMEVEKRFEHIDGRFDKIERDIEKIFNYLDAISKRLDITEDERVVMGHQIQRAFSWLKTLADKIGVELKP